MKSRCPLHWNNTQSLRITRFRVPCHSYDEHVFKEFPTAHVAEDSLCPGRTGNEGYADPRDMSASRPDGMQALAAASLKDVTVLPPSYLHPISLGESCRIQR